MLFHMRGFLKSAAGCHCNEETFAVEGGSTIVTLLLD